MKINKKTIGGFLLIVFGISVFLEEEASALSSRSPSGA